MLKDHNNIKRTLTSRTFTVVVLVLITFLGTALYKDYIRQSEVRTEMDQLELETEELRGKNVELSKLITILETSSYIEQEARKNLGLKKLGENVVSIPENARPRGRVAGASTQLEKRPPTAVQWFNYFFKETTPKTYLFHK